MKLIGTLILPSEELLFLLNVITVVVVASGATLLASLVWGRKSVPLRHGLLVCGLVVVLLAPLITWMAQRTNLGWTYVSHQEMPIHTPSSEPIPDAASVAVGLAEDPPIDLLLIEPAGEPEAEIDLSVETAVEPVPVAASQSESVSHVLPIPVQVPWMRLIGTALAILWGIGSALCLLVLLVGMGRVRAFRRRLSQRGSSGLDASAVRAAHRVGLAKPPRVYVSSRVTSPMVIGLFRPVIVVPVGMEDQCTPAQLEDALVHECAHVARRDQFLGLAQRLASALFWWWPLVHALNSRLSNSREELCDNYVLQGEGDGFRFAELLVTLAETAVTRQSLPTAVGMFGNSHRLEGRIRRLLNKEVNTMTRINRSTLILVLAFGFAITALASFANAGTAKQTTSTDLTPTPVSAKTHVGEDLIAQAPTAKPEGEEGKKPGVKKPALSPLRELYRKRGSLHTALFKARQRVLKSKELAEMQKKIDEANKAYTVEGDKLQKAAKAEEEKAMESLEQVKAKRVSASPELTKAQQEAVKLEKQKADAEYRMALAQFKLTHPTSPYRKAIAKNENIDKLRREMYRNKEARKAYNEAVAKAMKTVPGGEEVLSDLAKAKEEIATINKALSGAKLKLYRAFRSRDDKELRAAQDKYNAARRDAMMVNTRKEMRELGKARMTARDALWKKREELLKTDKEMVDLQKQIKEVDEQIKELRAKSAPKKPEGS